MSTAVAFTPPVVGFVHDDALPWVDAGDGMELKVLRVVESEGIWIVRTRFAPGAGVQRHRHTGQVHGFTLSGRWHYAEYGIDYVGGTYIHEPAGSIHTLTVNADNREPTDIFFVIEGANLNLDAEDQIVRIDDGPAVLEAYLYLCETQGHGRPTGILR